MRALIYILVCSVLFSCSNANKEEMMVEAAADVVEETTAPAMASEMFTYETITKQKLQELIDLKGLSQDHPEDPAIKNQLESISQSSSFLQINGNQKLTTIEALGKPKKLNDSVQNLRILFTTEDPKGEISKDSIKAVITTRMFILDGVEQVAIKVTFTSIHKKTP